MHCSCQSISNNIYLIRIFAVSLGPKIDIKNGNFLRLCAYELAVTYQTKINWLVELIFVKVPSAKEIWGFLVFYV